MHVVCNVCVQMQMLSCMGVSAVSCDGSHLIIYLAAIVHQGINHDKPFFQTPLM